MRLRDTASPEPAALSAAESARYIGIGVTALYGLVKQGTLTCRRYGGRSLFLRSDLDAWLLSLPVGRALNGNGSTRGDAGREAIARARAERRAIEAGLDRV